MKLVVSRRATRQLQAIADYIRQRNPTAALKVQRALSDTFTLLATYPESGRKIRAHLRRFALPRFPYLVYYTIDADADELVVLTIRHAGRRRRDD